MSNDQCSDTTHHGVIHDDAEARTQRAHAAITASTSTHQPLPPDRSNIATEQPHAHSADLDTLPIEQRAALIVDDHASALAAVQHALPVLSRFISEVAARMANGGRLIYLGAGTSGRLGVLDAAECPPTFQSDPDQIVGLIAGGDRSLRQSSEGMEDDADGATADLSALDLTANDSVLGIAAGGTTPYVLGGLILAADRSAMTGLLTCAAPTEPLPACDHLLLLPTGPEVLTGSTRLKAGTATKLALNIISTCIFIELGKVHSNRMVDVRASNDKLRDRAIRILLQYVPELDRARAADALAAADGSLKIAIIMQRCQLDRPAAEQLLAIHHGHLRPIIG